jgi:hypothetical protein
MCVKDIWNFHYLETQEGGLSSSDMERLGQLRVAYFYTKEKQTKELHFLEQLAIVYQLSSVQPQWRDKLKNHLSNQSASMASSPIFAKPAAVSSTAAIPSKRLSKKDWCTILHNYYKEAYKAKHKIKMSSFAKQTLGDPISK